MEQGEDWLSKRLKPFKSFVKRSERSEDAIDVSLTQESSQRLNQLVLRPNPTLAEFSFLCLGNEGVIDEILVASDDYSSGSGLYHGGFSGSKVDEKELLEIFKKLELSGRQEDLMVFGHLHPSGRRVIQGTEYVVEPNDLLLDPSMGSRESGGPVGGGDLAFFKSFIEKNPQIKLPYVGIAANTPEGPKLRIYNPQDLLRLRRYSHIENLPKRTIKL